MALRNRETLINYFKKGELPKEGHFEDLIESVVNIIDDGISVSIKEGLKITPLGELGNLISFYKEIEDENPQWSLILDKKNNVLSVNDFNNGKIVSFTGDGNVGIGTEEPEYKLDVSGIVSMEGRIGNYNGGNNKSDASTKVPADGNWHPILSGLDGAQAFEIMAGVGKRKTGKYALMHAIALSTFGGRSSSRIRKTQAHYRWFWHKILLRWRGSTYDYRLEMRTMIDYGENQFISYNITQLWFDEFMKNSQQELSGPDGDKQLEAKNG